MTENIETEQPTFNGMARQAMVMGVPLPALAVCGFVGTMAAMMTLPILEGSALFSWPYRYRSLCFSARSVLMTTKQSVFICMSLNGF